MMSYTSLGSTVDSAKSFIGLVGSFLFMVGASIEPSIGIWIISISGSLLTSTLGKDRSIGSIFFHILIGLGWGIFGSQIIHSQFSSIPQIAACFFAAMFGVEATWFVIRNLKESTFSDLISSIISGIASMLVHLINKNTRGTSE